MFIFSHNNLGKGSLGMLIVPHANCNKWFHCLLATSANLRKMSSNMSWLMWKRENCVIFYCSSSALRKNFKLKHCLFFTCAKALANQALTRAVEPQGSAWTFMWVWISPLILYDLTGRNPGNVSLAQFSCAFTARHGTNIKSKWYDFECFFLDTSYLFFTCFTSMYSLWYTDLSVTPQNLKKSY